MSASCAALLGDDAEAIMARLIKEAKKGEPVALRLAVERLVPVRAARDRAVDVDLPAIGKAADLVQAAAAVVGLAADGSITLSEAKEFMVLLEGQRRVIETADLAVRIEALERGRGGGSELVPAELRDRVEALEGTPEDAAARIAALVRRRGRVLDGGEAL